MSTYGKPKPGKVGGKSVKPPPGRLKYKLALDFKFTV
jgi:hypothetical protein